MPVTKWTIDGTSFDYNPSWRGGDSTAIEPKMNMIDIIGSNTTNVQVDGTRSPMRSISLLCDGSFHDTLRTKAIAASTVTIVDDLSVSRTYLIKGFRDQRVPSTANFNRWMVELELIQR